jgi:DNA processing protein
MPMDSLDAVAVSMLPVPRPRAATAFKEVHERARRQGTAIPSGTRLLAEILRSCGVSGPQISESVSLAMDRATAAMTAAGIAAPIALDDARYPVLLSCIPDPPPVIWVRGQIEALSLPIVAIVGSRRATPYARDVAFRLAQGLAERGMAVASGLARGVDVSAHLGCLDADGVTIAVLGSGVQRIYPAEHAKTVEKIVDKGCVISELWPDAPPLQEHFPLRNRIISGISLGIVVVEASEKSGSLITARYALEQGRDVMAVPGNVLSGRNSGSHCLLKDGAKVVESADDILDGLGWPVSPIPLPRTSKLLHSDSLLTLMAPGEIYRLDELMELTGVTGTRLLPRLMELELAGLVENTGAGFSRTSGNVGS